MLGLVFCLFAFVRFVLFIMYFKDITNDREGVSSRLGFR